MIAKIRRGSYFRGLQLYLLSELKGVPPEDVELRNLVSADTAASEMHLVAGRSQRVERAVYHVILAWAEEEKPTRDEQFAIGHELLERVGLGAHQALLARHTEPKAGLRPGVGRHFELHLMVNRVGPDGRALAMRNDYAVVERAVADIAAAHAMQVVPGRFNGQEGFVQGSSEAARSLAQATGRLSPAMELRADPDAMAELVEARARGWLALLQAFARHGIVLRESNRTAKQGQSAGLVMTMATDPDRTEKVSALDSPGLKWGRPTLERELGAFPSETAAASLSLSSLTAQVGSPVPKLKSDFEAAREAALAERRRISQAHDETKRRLLADQVGERQKLLLGARRRRSAVKHFFGRGSEVAGAVNLVLDRGFAVRLDRTLDEHRQDLELLTDRHRKALACVPVPTWADWRRTDRDKRNSPETEQGRSGPVSDQGSPDRVMGTSVAAAVVALDDHEQRRERLARNRERKSALRRGDLDARVAAITDDLCVAVAANVIRHFRPRRALRTSLLIITALASGSAIAPVVLAAAAVALLRRDDLKAKRAGLRADIDAARAARTGWTFADVSVPERARYAALVRSDLVDPAGPDARPLVAAIGNEEASRFVAWWAYATPKQRAVVEGWARPRSPRKRPVRQTRQVER